VAIGLIVLIWLIVGVVAGLVIAAVVGVSMMRSKMVVPERSGVSFDETCARVERVVDEAEGWSFPMPSFDMAAKLAEKGALPANVTKVRLYFVCSPPVAKRVLGDTPKLSAIMPCSWSVYELADGSVWLAHMNIGMMAKMMGGVVGESMGTVARAEDGFLGAILH
jgi:uncharacterized protein (DUF302 family)